MGGKASKEAVKAPRVAVPGAVARVNRNSSGKPSEASARKDSNILEDGRDPQLLANAASLGQVAITRPRTPFEANQPGVLQIRRRAAIEAQDVNAPNRADARSLQTLLYAHFSGRKDRDVPSLLQELQIDQATFDTLTRHISAFDFLDQEIASSSSPTARPLKMAAWPSPELTASKAKAASSNKSPDLPPSSPATP